jgi:hypothetical protein
MADLPPDSPHAGFTSSVQNKHSNDLHCKALAHTIASAERTIGSVLASPDLLLALAPLGYNELELNKGLTLATTAQSKFAARQEALAVAKLATKARDMAFDIAKKEFAEFQTAMEAEHRETELAERVASGPIPKQSTKFCATARDAYARGIQEPYVSLLSNCGFNRQRLTRALSVLDKLETAESANENALSKVKVATETRDVAADALMAWVDKLRAIASITLEDRPALRCLFKE